MIPFWRSLVLWALLTSAFPGVCVAQASAGAPVDLPVLFSGVLARPQLDGSGGGGSLLARPALSLVVPGGGQHVLGQNRKWLYAALEVVGWGIFLERRWAGGDFRDRYREFAWDQGRIQISARIDGDFDYYETLSKWTASGSFDTDAGLPGIQPETDPSTFNGSIWTLARQIFIPGGGSVPTTDPAYQSALAYYEERAYGPDFLWDWSAVPDGRQELGELIEASDDRFRQATTALGIVIANHLISAADAYLSARGRRAPVRLGVVPRDGAGHLGWSALLSVQVGR